MLYMTITSPQNPRSIAWAYLLALLKTCKRKRQHIIRLFTCQDKLCHPLSHHRRQLKAMSTDRKVLSPLDVLACALLLTWMQPKKLAEESCFNSRRRRFTSPGHDALGETA